MSVEMSESVNEADAWYQEAAFEPNPEYRDIFLCAESQYQEQAEAFDAVSEKGVVMCALCTAAAYFASSGESVLSFGAMVCGIVGAVAGFLAFRPCFREKPMSLKSMMYLVEIEPKTFWARLSASYYVATRGVAESVNKKSNYIDISAVAGLGSILLMVCHRIVEVFGV